MKINVDSEDVATLFAQNDGRISVNIKYDDAGSGKVALDGNIVAKDAASQIDVGLLGEEAYLKGFAFGEGKINMQMLGGAAWHNEKQGAALPAGFTGSRLSRLRGGPNKTSLALIFQNDDRNITIDDYKGHAKVFYAHDATQIGRASCRERV